MIPTLKFPICFQHFSPPQRLAPEFDSNHLNTCIVVMICCNSIETSCAFCHPSNSDYGEVCYMGGGCCE